jgi:glycosyltransferase involved in cell wall biosynthesis
MSKFRGKNIVVMSAVPWDGLYARPQQLSVRFVQRGARVFFVEPPWSLLSPVKQPALLRTWAMRNRVRRVEQDLVVYTPPPVLPGHNLCRFINRLNQRILHRAIERQLKLLGWELDLLWSHLPGSADFPGQAVTVYECVDDHAAFGGLADPRVVHAMEDELLRRACSVFASSQRLWERCHKLRPDVLLVGNGADYHHFSQAAVSGDKLNETIVVGFYGGIGPWIDIGLIFSAADMLPHHRFVMVGPVEPGVDISAAPANVEFPGLMKYADLPGVLAGYDVAMIPFKVNDITSSVNPIKLYEYFSAGKPVIVTPTEELLRFGDLVYPVSDPEGFVSAVEQALQEKPELALRRQKLAQRESWEQKLSAIENHLEVDECE